MAFKYWTTICTSRCLQRLVSTHRKIIVFYRISESATWSASNLTFWSYPDYQLSFKNICSSIHLDEALYQFGNIFPPSWKLSVINIQYRLSQVSLKTSISNIFALSILTLKLSNNCIHRINKGKEVKVQANNKELIHSHQHKMF